MTLIASVRILKKRVLQIKIGYMRVSSESDRQNTDLQGVFLIVEYGH